MPDTTVQINTSMDPETAAMLEQIAKDLGYDNRSACVRWLIRQEHARRYETKYGPVVVKPDSGFDSDFPTSF